MLISASCAHVNRLVAFEAILVEHLVFAINFRLLGPSLVAKGSSM